MSRINLTKLRRDKNITQKQLASMLGVPQSFVSQVENGKDPMPERWETILGEKYGVFAIAEYQIDEDTNNGKAEVTNLAEAMKLQADSYREIIEKKDQQISELLAIIKTSINPNINAYGLQR